LAEFTWVPIYAELADKVLEYRERQAELIGLLERLRADGLPVNASGDQFADGTTGVMKEIDPFTFFSNFNRGVTDDNRRAILSALKREFGLTRSLPTDFTGIPTVNNQASWFIAYQKDRKPTDVPTLWDIAASTRRDGAEGLDAELFVRGLAINRVALAKLTMGMFWFRPDGFVALDRNMKAYLEANGIAVGKIATVAEYRDVIHRVREKFGGDFKRISVDARMGTTSGARKRYWAGGFGRRERLKEMLEGGYWGHNFPVDAEGDGKRTWELFDQISAGDELAIKGYGGRNILKVYFVGEVTEIDRPNARVNLRALDRPHYHGKGPRGASPGFFKTLSELSEPAVSAVFHGEATATIPPPPPHPETDVDLPRNLIFYGPPGTGKTYSLLQLAQKHFSADESGDGMVSSPEEIQQLPLWQVLALALRGGKPMSVAELLRHPLVAAKNEASQGKRFKAQIWGNLQIHTKADCKNVGCRHHFARLSG
jgi:hypothetical protein